MEQKTVNFDIDGYLYGDRLLEGVMFNVTVSMGGTEDKPFTVKSVVPTNKSDKDYLLHIGGQGVIDKWCKEIFDDFSSDPRAVLERLDEAETITEEEADEIVEYLDKHYPRKQGTPVQTIKESYMADELMEMIRNGDL